MICCFCYILIGSTYGKIKLIISLNLEGNFGVPLNNFKVGGSFVAADMAFSVLFFFCCFVGRKLAKSTFFRCFVFLFSIHGQTTVYELITEIEWTNQNAINALSEVEILIILFILFVNDTNIFCSNSNIHSFTKTVNEELKNVSDWLKANKFATFQTRADKLANSWMDCPQQRSQKCLRKLIRLSFLLVFKVANCLLM